MKKLYSLMAAAVVAVSMHAQTPTQVLNDNFNYTGALTANGWVTHSGTAGQMTSNGSVASLVAGNSEDINKAFTTPYAISATQASMATYTATINVPNGTGLSTTGDYILMFAANAGTTSVTNFYGRLWVKGSATGYTLGILNNSQTTPTPTYGTEIPYGTPANITVTYMVNNIVTPATNVATLQINAQPLLTNSTGNGAIPTTIASIALREAGNATSGTGNITIDNLVATTFSSFLAVSDITGVQSNFVRNTMVNDEISFGTKSDVKVYNMNGQVVKSASVSANKNLNVAELQNGMYIVTGTVNGTPVSQKILKK